jgi:acetyl esterase/lipase
MTKAGTLLTATALALGGARAGASPWKPSPGQTEVFIWPGTAPDGQAGVGPEDELTRRQPSIAGKPWFEVANVTRPTLTVYPAVGKNTGAAVVVFPGGGYQVLAIDLEGTEICDWLTSRGITCVLAKYRVPGTKLYPKSAPYPKSGPYPKSPMALEDAQRTVGLVRSHAAEWKIDPHKIGVLGFSAGGHLVAAISTHLVRVYSRVDPADDESCRPDFAVALYPGHLWLGPGAQSLNPDIRVTSQTPPTFLLQAEDDPVDDVSNSLVYYAELKRGRVPVEMHLYARGGHAFGMRRTALPITAWPKLVETWLVTLGMISPQPN